MPFTSEERKKYMVEYNRRKRREVLAAGICIMCLKRPVIPGMVKCEACRTLQAKRSVTGDKRKRAKRASLGLCVGCGRPLLGQKTTHCMLCCAKTESRWR